MPYQINELLKNKEYDIYNNPQISHEKIKIIAEIISQDKSLDLEEYFDLLKCSSKFCWFNYLNILAELSEEDRIRGLPLLFELLKDDNWPTYQQTVQLLNGMDKKTIEPYLKKYLALAYEEDDEMWVSNINLLASPK